MFKIVGIDNTIKILNTVDKEKAENVSALAAETALEILISKLRKHNKTGIMANRAIQKRISPTSYAVGLSDRDMLVEWNGKKINYGIFVRFGSRPHDILPKNKKALRWCGVNGFIFAKRVHHPGYKGDDFIYATAQETFKKINKLFEEE